MSPFWGSFFGQLRGCGRNAALFLLAFAGLFIVLMACVIANSMNLFQHADLILETILVAVLARVGIAAYKARTRPRERFRRKPLSSDEARVARSKLLKRKVSNNWRQ